MDNTTKKHPRTLSGADGAFKDADYASSLHVVQDPWGVSYGCLVVIGVCGALALILVGVRF